MGLRRIFICGVLIVVMLVTFNLAPSTADESPALRLLWQTEFSSDTALVPPSDIAVDRQGNVYLTSQSSQKIKIFDSQGNLTAAWGSSGSDDGEFSFPLGLAVDAQNNVYVTDFTLRRIQKFDAAGTFLLQWATDPDVSPAFIAVDGEGSIVIDNFPPRDRYLQKFDLEGETEWLLPNEADDQLGNRPEDITLDQAGNIYVADPLAHVVYEFDGEGELIATFGGETSEEGEGQFEDPFGIGLDGDGNIYVLDSNFLQKLDPEGNFIAQWSTTGELDQAANLAVDWQGNIYLLANANVTAANGATVNVPVLKKFQQPKQPV